MFAKTLIRDWSTNTAQEVISQSVNTDIIHSEMCRGVKQA